MNLVTITAPSVEPVTLAEMRLQLLMDDDFTAQDAYITGLIQTAREYGEHYTGCAFIERTVEASFPYFEHEFELPLPPLQYVTAVQYLDTNGVLQTLAASAYQADNRRAPAVIKPAYNQTWPSVRSSDYNAVRVRYVCGHAPASSPQDAAALRAAVPAAVAQWMKMRVHAWYETRSPVITGTIVATIPRDYMDGLLDPLKVWHF